MKHSNQTEESLNSEKYRLNKASLINTHFTFA